MQLRQLSGPAVLFALAALGCGGSASPKVQRTITKVHATTPAESSAAATDSQPVNDDTPPRPSGSPPSIGSIDDAEAAAARGYYREAAEFLRRHETARARFGAAVAALGVGAYEEAQDLAVQVTNDRTWGPRADRLRAKALLALGREAEASKVLEERARNGRDPLANALLGRLLVASGRSQEADPFLRMPIEAYNAGVIGARDADGFLAVAIAAWSLGSHVDANEAFRQASNADPKRTDIQLEWARLFLEKYDAKEAETGVRAVLAQNPNDAEAHALMARIRLEQGFRFAPAQAYAERALECNPRLAEPSIILAHIALFEKDWKIAEARRAQALHTDTHNAEALALGAVAFYATGDNTRFERDAARFLATRPWDNRVFEMAATYAEWDHRYIDIVAFSKRALAIDGEDAVAHAVLGINLLRLGDEKGGLVELREAWKRDHYNARVLNLLELYEETAARDYETISDKRFVFRLHKEERPVLSRYLPEIMRESYETFQRFYGVTPPAPIHVELWASSEQFSISATGLPRLGLEGVCFGNLITVVSPRAEAVNWGQVTVHELAHVFHLALSKNRVPRWFTEGLAEYDAATVRKEWKREEDYLLRDMLEGGRLPPIAEWDRAFIHATSARDLTAMYFASYLLMDFLVQREDDTDDSDGRSRLRRMLQAWGNGKPTEVVVADVLGISIGVLDRDFREHLRTRFAAGPADPWFEPGQASVAGPTGIALLFRDAHRAAARRDPRAAERALRAIIAAGSDGYRIRMALADLREAQADLAGASAELERAVKIDPERVDGWLRLWALARATDNSALSEVAVGHITDLDQHNREAWDERVRIEVGRKDWSKTASLAEAAIFVDPYNAEIHASFARARLETKRAEDALDEIDVSLTIDPKSGAAHLLRARILRALGRAGAAKQEINAAIELDPKLRSEAEHSSAP